jgi:tRNA(Arg) A34 adenosine deaminase TadA
VRSSPSATRDGASGAWQRLTGGSLCTSCEPCLLCSFVITQIGLGRVVFAARGTGAPTCRPLLGAAFRVVAARVNAQSDWTPLEVVGDFMRARETITASAWGQSGSRAPVGPPA